MKKRFPDEYRQTLERLVRQQLDDARVMGLTTVAQLEGILARIRHPDFGVCRSCGAVLSLARLVQDVSVTLCTECLKTVS